MVDAHYLAQSKQLVPLVAYPVLGAYFVGVLGLLPLLAFFVNKPFVSLTALQFNNPRTWPGNRLASKADPVAPAAHIAPSDLADR